MAAMLVTDSRQTILDAAQELILRSGYAGLSMRELSRQSGLAKSTLYHHFADKHEIYLSVLERELLLHEEQLAAAAAVNGTSSQRLASVVHAYFELINRHGSVALSTLRRTGELDEQLLALFRQHRPRVLTPVVEVLQEGIAQGEFRPVDVDLMVLGLLGMVNGFVAQRVILGCDDEALQRAPGDLAEFVIDLLVRGLLNEHPKKTKHMQPPAGHPQVGEAAVVTSTAERFSPLAGES